MENVAIALLIRPFAAAAIMVMIVVPIEYAIWNRLEDGPLRRFLFMKIY